MTRFLQSLLALTLIVIVFQIASSAYFFFAMNRLRDYDPGPEYRSQLHSRITWDHWPFAIGRAWQYDSTTKTGGMHPFIGLSGARSPKRTDESLDRILDGDQLRTVMWDNENYPLVYIPEEKFQKAKWLSIIIFAFELVLTVYIWRKLFQFVRLAGRKEFFEAGNGGRLLIIGWFITISGIFSFISPFISFWLFSMWAGIGPKLEVRLHENVGSLYWVIAGLLLLVIAEAFRKGTQLQTEQEFTV